MTRDAMYGGPMEQMLKAYFPEGTAMVRFDATKGAYVYPGAAGGPLLGGAGQWKIWYPANWKVWLTSDQTAPVR
jgi:hypothetical protein